MDCSLRKRKISRDRRVKRNRKNTKGSAIKPRLSVYKSNKNLFAQLIDDEEGKTLFAVGTGSKEKMKKSRESAKVIGQKIAEAAKKINIEHVVFDRGRLKYHGLIAEIADAARGAGLKF